MGNCNTTKHTCGEKNYATCIYYEKDVPEFSGLIDEDCTTVEETIEDLYEIVGNVKDDFDLSALGELCLTYVTGEEVNTVKKVLLKYEQEICELKEKVEILETEAICNKSIVNCDLDLSGIEDPCGEPITTLSQLLQYLVTNSLEPS